MNSTFFYELPITIKSHVLLAHAVQNVTDKIIHGGAESVYVHMDANVGLAGVIIRVSV